MNPKEQEAYNEALARIKACRKSGGTSLSLSQMGLTQIPPEIGQLTALTQLRLGDNQLTSLPPEIGQLTALTRLSLGGNQMTSLPPEIGQLTALTVLDLSSNKLTSLPPEIGQLTALTELYLGGNQLTSLPPEIVQLSDLNGLYLSGNKLTSLPPEIGQLSALTVLFLHENQLTSLPPEIGQLTALMELDLRDNQLKSLPLLPARLESLGIEGNPLESLDSHLFDVVNQDALPPKLIPLMLEHRASQERASKKWRIRATHDSALSGTPSRLAILETVVFASVFCWALSHGHYSWLALPMATAPLAMLRTRHSVMLGVKLYQRSLKAIDYLNRKPLLAVYGKGLALVPGSFVCVWAWQHWGVWCAPGLLLLPGIYRAALLFPFFFLLRFVATLIATLQKLPETLLSIPENWQRLLLATDITLPPEFLPGQMVDISEKSIFDPIKGRGFEPLNPRNAARKIKGGKGLNELTHRDPFPIRSPQKGWRGWHNAWAAWSSLILLYPLTAIYRWSVKATCWIYAPLLFWPLRKLNSKPEPSMDVTLKKHLRDEVNWVLYPWSLFVLAGFLLKLLHIAAVPMVVDGLKNLLASGWAPKYAAEGMPRAVQKLVAPDSVPWWQVAAAVNAAMAFGMWWYARSTLRDYELGPAPQEVSVSRWWRALSVVSAFLTVYTVFCTAAILYQDPDFWKALKEIRRKIGTNWLPW